MLLTDLAARFLRDGRCVRFCAPGHSMHPTIRHGDVLIVTPLDAAPSVVGDILLYRTRDRLIAHRVVEILSPAEGGPAPGAAGPLRPPSDTGTPPMAKSLRLAAGGALLASLRGRNAPPAQLAPGAALRFILKGDCCQTPDAPVAADQILGKVVAVERGGRRSDPCSLASRLHLRIYRLISRLLRPLR